MSPEAASSSPDEPYEIVFVSDADGYEGLYVMTFGRTASSAPPRIAGPLPLGPGHNRAWWPTWCGDEIFYEARILGDASYQEIWRVAGDGSVDPTYWGEPSGTGRPGSPRCSPNGAYMGYSRPINQESAWGLYLYEFASGQANPFDTRGFLNGQMTWAADCRSVAYYHMERQHDERGSIRLGTLGSGSGGELVSTVTRDGAEIQDTTFPAIAPNGRQIAFGCSIGGRSRLCIMGIDGRNPMVLAPHAWTATSLADGLKVTPVTPAWSPDGQWIAFTSTMDGDPDIWRVRPDGSGLENLTRGGLANDFMPIWRQR